MLQDFKQFIEENHLTDTNGKLLVAISGGVDSVVLGHLLHQCQFDVALAHCNFQLRGEESDKDQALIEDLAVKWGLKLFTKKFETEKLAKDQRISIQMVARNLRYEWFGEVCHRHNYTHIVTAHHRNDHIESMLLNLIRGTGLRGLEGIPVVRDNIIRPLLFATKEQILDYANDEGLSWREDQSNEDVKYRRNFVRKEIIPLLRTINPNIEESLNRTANYLSQVGEVFEEEMLTIASQIIEVNDDVISITIDRIKPEHRTTAFLSFQLLKYNFNQIQIESILRSLTKTGLMFYSGTHQLNIDRGKLLISPQRSDAEYYEHMASGGTLETQRHKLVFNEVDATKYQIQSDDQIAAFDSNLIKYPMVVRSWQEGDYFVPLGMKGKKKLSDFMIDRKIPLNLKERQLVLSSENEIAWVIGQQISEKFKITDDTLKVLEIKLVPKNA